MSVPNDTWVRRSSRSRVAVEYGSSSPSPPPSTFHQPSSPLSDAPPESPPESRSPQDKHSAAAGPTAAKRSRLMAAKPTATKPTVAKPKADKSTAPKPSKSNAPKSTAAAKSATTKSAVPKSTAAPKATDSKSTAATTQKKAKANGKAKKPSASQDDDFPWDEANEWLVLSQTDLKPLSPPPNFDEPSPDAAPSSSNKRKQATSGIKKGASKRPRKSKAKAPASSPLSSATEESSDDEGPVASSSRMTLDGSTQPPSPERSASPEDEFITSTWRNALSHTPSSSYPGRMPFLESSAASMDVDEDDDDEDDDLGAALAKAEAAEAAKAAEDEDMQVDDEVDAVVHSPDPPPPFKPTTLPIGVDNNSACYVKYMTCFFPGVLLAFHPAQTAEDQAKNRDRYEVRRLGGPLTPQLVKRQSVIFPCDRQIATCVLGELRTELAEPERGRREQRLPTPELNVPQDMDAATFRALDWARQLVAIRPHLARVIAEEYEPAQWRIDDFFKSAVARANLPNEIDVGDVPDDEQVTEILPELRRWAVLAPEPEINGAPNPTGEATLVPTRPRGSQRFEDLRPSSSEFTDYLHFVLMPEALLQVYIRSTIMLPQVEAHVEPENEHAPIGEEGTTNGGEANPPPLEADVPPSSAEDTAEPGPPNDAEQVPPTSNEAESTVHHAEVLAASNDAGDPSSSQAASGTARSQYIDTVSSQTPSVATASQALNDTSHPLESQPPASSQTSTPSGIASQAIMADPTPPPASQEYKPGSEEDLYHRARAALRLLAENDDLIWTVRRTELKRARKRMREKLRLPPEGGGVDDGQYKVRSLVVKEKRAMKERERALANYARLEFASTSTTSPKRRK